MVNPSSTFSSELTMPRPGFPTGILVGLGTILVVEALLCFVPEQSRLIYGRGVGADYEVVNGLSCSVTLTPNFQNSSFQTSKVSELQTPKFGI